MTRWWHWVLFIVFVCAPLMVLGFWLQGRVNHLCDLMGW